MTGMKDTRSKIVATYFCFWLTLKTEAAVSKLVELDLTLPWPGSPFSLDSWGYCITSFKQPEKNKQTNKQTNSRSKIYTTRITWEIGHYVAREGGGGIEGLWLLWIYMCCDKIYLMPLRLYNILVISPPLSPSWQLICSISSIVPLSYSFGDYYFPLWSPSDFPSDPPLRSPLWFPLWSTRLPHLTPCHS